MQAKDFKNTETFKTFQWLNNTEEFYKQICKEIDNSPQKLEQKIFDIVNSIVLSVQTGAGSNAAHFMLEDIGNPSIINYNDLVMAFTQE